MTDEKAWSPSLWSLRGSQSLSGETVTEDSALTYSAIWNAVTLLSSSVSCLPLHLLRKDNQKTLHVDQKRLYRVLHDQFNPEMSSQVARETMMAHILLWGNAYAEIVRNGTGEIQALWPISPNRVSPKRENGVISYDITVDGQTITLPKYKILHVPGLGFDGLTGYSIVAMARKSFGLGMALETFGSLYFGQGTHVGRVLSHPGQMSAQARANLIESFSGTSEGLAKSHKLMLLEEGMKLEKIGIPPEDSQFLESRQFHIAEIARWFNLPPHKLKDLSRSSFSNIESEQISFVTDSILPWLIRFEQSYNMQLLSENEQFKQKIFTRHNVDGLLRGNAQSRAEYYRTMFGIGAMSINDIRDKEGWDAVENGDERFIPLNMIPLSKIDQYLERQTTQSKPGAADEPDEKKEEPSKLEDTRKNETLQKFGIVREKIRISS